MTGRVAGAARQAWRLLGRRGVSLLFVGMLGLVLAASLTVLPPGQMAAYTALAALAPLPVWASAWMVSALLCWFQAFRRQDRIAFATATAMWWLYGIAYLLGVVNGLNPRGWVGGLIWLAFGGWLNLIATWPEAPPAPAGPVREE
ncbi:hypothetical protein AB0395_21775 [Streptosporangium sp. NPDC051023]|uniref:hypothetical protein n=1 Tax=Streptosporangium sp. NPDC051023 TaxID=3155410 RepID=UPI00344EC983